MRGWASDRVVSDDDFLIEARREEVAAASFGDRQVDAILPLHLFVAEADRFAVLNARDLHPDQVVRIVDHAHLVGFGIAHPNTGFVRRHRIYSFARLHSGPRYLPRALMR